MIISIEITIMAIKTGVLQMNHLRAHFPLSKNAKNYWMKNHSIFLQCWYCRYRSGIILGTDTIKNINTRPTAFAMFTNANSYNSDSSMMPIFY